MREGLGGKFRNLLKRDEYKGRRQIEFSQRSHSVQCRDHVHRLMWIEVFNTKRDGIIWTKRMWKRRISTTRANWK